MIQKLLTAKHWQLFILTFGVQMLVQIAMMGYFFSAMISNDFEQNPFLIFDLLKYFPIVMILLMIVYLAWIYSVSVGLQSKVPSNVSMKVKKFKIFFFIPIVYNILFMIGFSLWISSMNHQAPLDNFVHFENFFPIFFPVNLFAMFCSLYTIYFTAKTIKTVELQREVKFGEFVGEFFLIWFYFIGVWILQPKINKMVELDTETSNPERGTI